MLPIRPEQLMRRELDRVLGRWPEAGAAGFSDFCPVDIQEDDERLYVEAELPGFKKDEISVALEQGVLSIVAERQPKEFKGTRHLQERRYTRVQRSIMLPVNVDESKVKAVFEDGILKLEFVKSPAAQHRRIRIT